MLGTAQGKSPKHNKQKRLTYKVGQKACRFNGTIDAIGYGLIWWIVCVKAAPVLNS